MNKIYDTNTLLLLGESVFSFTHFYVSSITFNELEHIKTANNKDNEIKYKARQLLHYFHQQPEHYTVILHKIPYEESIIQLGYELNNDTKILSDILNYKEPLILVTNDISLKCIAESCGVQVETIDDEKEDYTGYKDIIASEEELNNFYQDSTQNIFNLLQGQYLILRNQEQEVIDLRRWDGTDHRFLHTDTIKSEWMGNIMPFHNDIYQKLLFDSLYNNKITMVRGPAGSGKSLVSLSYLMSLMEKGKLDRILVFCNPVATLNSAKLGFYPGDRVTKLLDSQIGNMLNAKLGGKEGTERLINSGKLELLPFSDIRGFDTGGLKTGVYITEAQNLDRTLIKLALQRIGEDSILILDGDTESQVDLPQYAGFNNGMRRVSEVFRDKNGYGEVKLNKIYRSWIASTAEEI